VQDGGNDRGRHVQPDVGNIARCVHGAERSSRVESGARQRPAHPDVESHRHFDRQRREAAGVCSFIVSSDCYEICRLLCTDTRVPGNALVMWGAGVTFLRGFCDNFVAISAIPGKRTKLKRSSAGPICDMFEPTRSIGPTYAGGAIVFRRG
jgi:hypothetical protein